MADRALPVAGLMVLAGLALVAVGVRTEMSRADGVRPASTETASTETAAALAGPVSLATPVLSARRVPDLLVRPQAARRLNAKVTPLLASAPVDRCVVIADGPTVLFAEQPDTPMTPASNMKLLTALAALDILGPDATFTTTFSAGAAPVGGVVDGDLWMIGGGDPLIDSDTYQSTLRYGRTPHTRLEDIADQLVAAGVTSITGSIRGDDTFFDNMRTVPTWPARYVAQNQVGPLSALSVNDARTYPAVAGAGGGTPQPASDPPAYAATALTQALTARGVTVSGVAGSGTAPAGLAQILAVPSLPVSAIVGEMLRYSDNNTAELLQKAMGREVSRQPTTAAGVLATAEVLARKNLSTEGVTLLDGSGLDIGNKVTCRLLESVLGAAGPTGPLADGLPVADGPDGTLKDRFNNSPAAGAVRAKTGTLKAVTALSGWVTTTSGAQVKFSIMLNTGGRDVSAADRDFEARVAEAVLSYPDAVDPAVVAPKAPA